MKKAVSKKVSVQNVKRKKGFYAILNDTKAWVLMLPTLIIMYFFVVRPILTGFWFSLHEMQGFTVKKFAGLENYITILSDTQFVKILINTLMYVVWSFVIGFIPPVAIAIMMNEMVHFKGWFKFSTYFPCIVPAVAATMLWYYMYLPNESGLLNTVLAYLGIGAKTWLQNDKLTIPLIIVSCTWKSMGGSIILYLAALQGVNQELYEAAIIDGAGFLHRIFVITLPSIASVVLLNTVRQVIAIFQIMVEPMTMTGGGPNGASTSIALWAYRTAFIEFNAGTSLAIGVVTFLILVVLTIFYFRVKRKFEID